MKTLIGTVLTVIGMTATAITIAYANFAPKSIVREVRDTKAVVCLIAIEVLDKKDSMKYCKDMM